MELNNKLLAFQDSAEYVQSRIKINPELAVIAGSGIFNSIKGFEPIETIKYEDIPNFPVSSIKGHNKELIIAKFGGRAIALFTGRFHYYEGWDMARIVSPVVLSYFLGAKGLVLTNAAGGLNKYSTPGDIMLINDIINMSFRSTSQLWGDLSKNKRRSLIDNKWREAISRSLVKKKINFSEGSYICVSGPNYETPAEIRAYRTLGGDAIGMSTVFEAQAALALDMPAIACSLITNKLLEVNTLKLSHEDVLETAEKGASRISAFIETAIEKFHL